MTRTTTCISYVPQHVGGATDGAQGTEGIDAFVGTGGGGDQHEVSNHGLVHGGVFKLVVVVVVVIEDSRHGCSLPFPFP